MKTKKKKIGRPKPSLYLMTQAEVARVLGTSRQRVAEIEKRALAKVAYFLERECVNE